MFCGSNVFSLLCCKVIREHGGSPELYEGRKHIFLVRFDLFYYLEGEIVFFPGVDPIQWLHLLD